MAEIPAVQRYFAKTFSSVLAKELHTHIEIGHIGVGLFNKVILNDVIIYDRNDKVMLKGKRLAAKIEWRSLREKKINIRTLEMSDVYMNLYKRKNNEKPNFQFIIDAFASKDTTNKQGTNIRINSLIVRRANVSYDEYYREEDTTAFNTSHIAVSDLNANVSLKELSNDSINLRIRSISLREKSGLDLRHLAMNIVAGKDRATVRNFSLNLPATKIEWDSLVVNYDKPLSISLSHIRGGKLNIDNSYITPSDIACFLPFLSDVDQRFSLSGQLLADSRTAVIKNISIKNESENIVFVGDVNAIDWKKENRVINANIDKLMLTATGSSFAYRAISKEAMPPLLARLGNITFVGNGSIYRNNYHVKGDLTTSVGRLFTDMGLYGGKKFAGKVISQNIALGNLLANNKFGDVTLDVKAEGVLTKGAEQMYMQGKVARFAYDNYLYQNITLDGVWREDGVSGSLALNDPNALININGELRGLKTNRKSLLLNAAIGKLNPLALNLTKRYGNDATFDLNFTAKASGSTINDMLADISIRRLRLNAAVEYYELNNLNFESKTLADGTHVMKLESDFADAELQGYVTPHKIHDSFLSIINKNVPSLGIKARSGRNNEFIFAAKVKRGDFFEKILGIPIKIEKPIELNGSLSDAKSKFLLTGSADDVEVYGQHIKNFSIYGRNIEEEAHFIVQGVRHAGGADVKFEIDATGKDDKILSKLRWNNKNKDNYYNGSLDAVTSFEYVESEGGVVAVTDFAPTYATIYGMPWDIKKSRICIAPKRFIFDDFSISNGEQLLHVSGNYSRVGGDDLVGVTLKRIDITYIFDLLNFHPVDFAGYASGNIKVGTDENQIKLEGNIKIDSFAFNKEVMGTLAADAKWNAKESQVDIDAIITDGIGGKTIAKGYVSPAKDGLDLRFDSQNTTVGFLNYYLDEIFSELHGTASGWCRLFGKFSDLDLEGEEVMNVSGKVKAVGAVYRIKDDTLHLSSGRMKFENITLEDMYGNKSSVKGNVYHDHLREIRYDFMMNADHFLSYDFDANSDEPFYGKVFGTGRVHLYGASGRLNANINIRTEKGTSFIYNASKPSEVMDNKLLVFYDRTPENKAIKSDTTYTNGTNEDDSEGYTSDINLTFDIEATPDATLQIIMDEKTGDYVSFHGVGDLAAAYYNKGKFQLTGVYNVVDGLYRLSIQDVVRKDFKFQPGGTLTFRGEPFDGDLDLQAVYTANSVSLNELSSSQGFSNNNIRVDCILNIGGKAKQPQISFDLDLPTLGEEEKLMVRNLISTDEEKNIQVMYLLSIGRFYTMDYANNSTSNTQNQSTMAMTSLLTNTLNSQLNDVLSNAINASNWSFGTNVYTGREGWSDMEIDGLVSGRLLNNRLLFNGNFGYRESSYYNTNFVGDFNLQWFLTPRGNISLKAYSETNDRYFTKSSLTTQGIGIVVSREFGKLSELWRRNRNNADSTKTNRER